MDFLLAVAKNDLDKVRHFLQSGFDVNTPILWNARDTYSPVLPKDVASRPELRERLQPSEEYHCRPLNIAVLGGYADMARLLLSAGADINLKDGRGRTALVCAIYGLDLDVGSINTSNLPLISQTHEHHLDIMKNVIMCHPNIFVSTLDSPQFEIQGITPLCLASYLGKADIIRLLLDDGRVNVDGTDSKSATPLMYAARDGNLPIVKILLSYNASPDITDNHGWSAIQYAGLSPEIVQIYEEALRCKRHELAHLHSSVSLARYPLHYSKLSTLVASLPEYPSSLSHLQFNTLKDIDLLDPTAAPVVQLLQTAFLQAIKNHDHNTLRTLLLWSPPLSNGQRAMSGPLLVNYHDSKTGMTALHHAMRTKPLPSLETIALLFQAGADINSQTYYGRTALHHLARFGVDKDGKNWGIQKSNKGEAKAHSPTLPHRNVRPGRMDSVSSATSSVVTGTTAVEDDSNRYSVQSSGSASSVLGGDITDPVLKQIMAAPTVPQHLAMCASLLIRLGALVNIADPTGNTPLHFAAEFGGVPEVLEVLIMEGNADLTLKNKKGLTPVDMSRTEEVRKRILALEHERKISFKTKSTTSYTSGNIRPLETASDCRSVLSRSVSRLTLHSSAQEPKWRVKRRGSVPDDASKRDSDAGSDIETDFENILKAFFSYQTTFTDSIESALAKITDSILHAEQQRKQANVGQIISRLRYELREAHKMFDDTEERAQRVMLHYRQELEQIEQIYQSDLEMSELQGDKVDKLLDVFERIESRFSQLEMEQDDMIHQVEKLRQATARRIDKCSTSEVSASEFQMAVRNLSQSLVILDTVSVDPVLYSREDMHRLWRDMGQMVERVVKEIDQRPEDAILKEARETISTRWDKLRQLPNAQDLNDKENDTSNAPSINNESDLHCQPTYWQRQLTAARLYHQRGNNAGPTQSLNELELAFDIQHANLNEVQKDLDQTNKLIAQIVVTKREVYDACLRLESELDAGNFTEQRSETAVRFDLEKILRKAKLLFDKQAQLESERGRLRKELIEIEKQLDETCRVLRQVRPPVLLQGLLERLESDEINLVRIEKDWKEDSQYVTEVFEPEEDDSDDTDSASSDLLPMNLDVFKSELSLQCLIMRLDASLYSLKVLAKSHIGRSRQMLMDVQTALSTSNAELEEMRQQMNVLYDDAAEVAHQVFTLKTELETIVRHRKEEIAKVWEVVEEVSEGVEINQASNEPPVPLPVSEDQRAVEDQDRHQWIVRELEQLQNVHENLQEAIEDLQRDQEEIAHTLRQLASAYIEPQVNKLVGQDDASLLTISDRLTDLLERIRQREFGVSTDENANSQEAAPPPQAAAATATSNTSSTKQTAAASRSPVAKRISVASLQSMGPRNHQRDPKRVSAAASVRTDRKRMSMMSNASFTSLSSYQQDRMLARASTLSNAFSRSQHSLVSHRAG